MNKKRFYKKMFLTYIGISIMLISVIFMVIFGITINDKDLSGKIIFIFLCLSLIGLIMFIIPGNFGVLFTYPRVNMRKLSLYYDYKHAGVPNNKYKEFKISFFDICSNHINLEEVYKGVYIGIINNKSVVFDMKGWHNQTYYIYEYFLSILQIKLSKGDKEKIVKKLQCNVCDIKLNIKMKNGSIKRYSLIENNFTKLSFKFSERIRVKIKISNSYTSKININSLYEFNV